MIARLKDLAKDRSELPKNRGRNIRNYVEVRFPIKGSNSRMLADSAFGHLQRYLDEKIINENITNKDITNLISLFKEKRTASSTIANYLGQYVPFFKHENLHDIAKYANDKKKEFHKQALAENKYAPMRSTELQKLYEIADLEDKVLIRLLLFEHSIAIGKIAKMHLAKVGQNYIFFDCDNKKVNVNSETVNLIRELMNLNSSKDRNRFLHYKSRRTLDSHIEELSQAMRIKFNLKYDLYAKNLRRFGKNVHIDDLTKWLSEAFKKE